MSALGQTLHIPLRTAWHTSLAARACDWRSHATLLLAALMAIAAMAGPASDARAAAHPGNPAPDFSTTALDGKTISLSSLRGRWVALEWTNPECPFVQKHYNSGNMQNTQQYARDRQVSWIQINSTHPGHGDFKTPEKMAAWNASMKAILAAAVLDQDGRIGKAYGAKTTPQMVLIDPTGKVVYHGAIDSIRSANVADIPKATNHMLLAMQEALSGRPVSLASTVPYGCSVKY